MSVVCVSCASVAADRICCAGRGPASIDHAFCAHASAHRRRAAAACRFVSYCMGLSKVERALSPWGDWNNWDQGGSGQEPKKLQPVGTCHSGHSWIRVSNISNKCNVCKSTGGAGFTCNGGGTSGGGKHSVCANCLATGRVPAAAEEERGGCLVM